MAKDFSALLADLEVLRRDFERLFALDVAAVVRTDRRYWPSRYEKPKPAIEAPGPMSHLRLSGTEHGEVTVEPKAPASAEEMESAPIFFDAGGRPFVNSVGQSLAVRQGWFDDYTAFASGVGADRFRETFERAGGVVIEHGVSLMAILWPGERVRIEGGGAWPAVVDRVAELARMAALRPPAWHVTNGRTMWSAGVWERRDDFSLGDPFYSESDLERIGDEPERMFADRDSFIRDSELALEWLINQVKRRADAAREPEAAGGVMIPGDGLFRSERAIVWGGVRYDRLTERMLDLLEVLTEAYNQGREGVSFDEISRRVPGSYDGGFYKAFQVRRDGKKTLHSVRNIIDGKGFYSLMDPKKT